MEKKKKIITLLTVLFIMMTGILYCSCENNSKGDKVSLNQKNNTEEQVVDEQASIEQASAEQAVKRSGDEVEAQDLTQDQSIDTKEDTNDNIQQDGLKDKNEQDTSSENAITDSSNRIFVHICGAVKKPDVYEVNDNSRIFDIIKLAGGLSKNAADDYVNQAAMVEDGQQVYIPTKEEVKGTSLSDYMASNKETSVDNNNLNGKSVETSSDSSKVNINTASKEELMTLTGIGESKADSIIEYRKNNSGFQSKEDIMNIKGIKKSVYNKISDRITVH